MPELVFVNAYVLVILILFTLKFLGLPPHSTPAQAKEYFLACIIPPDDEDWAKDAVGFFCKQVNEKTVQLNVEYKIPGQQQVISLSLLLSPSLPLFLSLSFSFSLSLSLLLSII